MLILHVNNRRSSENIESIVIRRRILRIPNQLDNLQRRMKWSALTSSEMRKLTKVKKLRLFIRKENEECQVYPLLADDEMDWFSQ